MSYTYADRRRGDRRAQKKETGAAQPDFDALRSGAAQPTAEQMGHRVDLPDAMRTKMENAFGADLSAVKLYESQAVADAGAKAFTQGTNIAFAPGLVDFSSYGGQSLLGHELSHVVSQARGEVTGSGLLNDYSLEARADREGAMAAAGQQIAMPTAAMSSVTASAAAGPMQAKDKDKDQENIRISSPTPAAKASASVAAAGKPAAKKTPPPVPTAPHPVITDEMKARAAAAAKALKEGKTPPAQSTTPAAPATPATPVIPGEDLTLNDVTEPVSGLTDQTNDILDKTGDIMDEGSVKAAMTDRHGKEGREAIGDRVSMGKHVTGLMTSAAGTYGGVKDLHEAVANVEEAKKTGSRRAVTDAKYEVADKATDLTQNLAGVAESSSGLAALKAGTTAARVAEEGFSTAGDVAGVAQNFVGAVRAGHKIHDTAQMRDEMSYQQWKLEHQKDPNANQTTVRDMYEMAKYQSELENTDAKFELAQSLTEGTGNVLGMALNGAGGVAADIGAKLVSAGIGKVKNAVHEHKQDQNQRAVLDKQTGLSRDVDAMQSDEISKKFMLDREDYEKAVIRQRGAASGKVGELYNMHARKQTDALMGMDKASPEREQFGKSSKIDLDAEKADEAVYHHIGGTDTEFAAAGSDPFEEKAARNKAIKESGGYFKHYKKLLGEKAGKAWAATKTGAANAWENTKTGAGKAAAATRSFFTDANARKQAMESMKAGAGKAWEATKTGAGKAWEATKTGAGKAWDATKTGASRAWEATKTGAGKAADATKSFFTDAGTRQRAWDAVKEAPGKAWQKTKTGVSDAFAYSKDVAKHKMKTLREEHEDALQQFNENRDSYKGMSLLDRAKWTIQNPLARIRMGTKSGQEKADYLMAKRWQSDEIAGAIEDREAEKKKKKEEA